MRFLKIFVPSVIALLIIIGTVYFLARNSEPNPSPSAARSAPGVRRTVDHIDMATIPYQLAARPRSHAAEGEEAPRWEKIEADNGTIYRVDLNSIGHSNLGSATVTVESEAISPIGRTVFLFDCHSHFMNMNEESFGTWMYAAPRSVAGRISAIACTGARNTTLEDSQKDDGAGETPSEYCAGFSTDECDRIKAVVASRKVPDFCKPGFAIEGSPVNEGFTREQFRMCYLMTSSNMPHLKTQ